LNIYETGGELLKKPWPDNPFWLNPYIPHNSTVILFGRAGIGKSAITWQMAQAIQDGSPIWGLPTQQTNVLYIELDTPESVMAQRFLTAEPQFTPNFTIVSDEISWDYRQFLSPAPHGEAAEIMYALQDLHKKYSYGVVFIDALRHVVPGDLSASGIARRIYDAFKLIFKSSALVFVHHERKSGQQMFGSGDPLQSAAGSMEFINAAQVALHFYRKGRDTWLDHLKSQATAEMEPMPISLSEDGIYVIHRDQQKNSIVSELLVKHKDLPARELDKIIAEALHVKERTGRTVRLGFLQKESNGKKIDTGETA